MAVNPLRGVRGTAPVSPRPPDTARVTKIDGDGVWIVPLDGDMRVPAGPCRRGGPGVTVGAVCLVVWTDERPWVFPEVEE